MRMRKSGTNPILYNTSPQHLGHLITWVIDEFWP
jgi:hypothetical protein